MPNNPPDHEDNEIAEGVDLWGKCGEFSLPGTLWIALLNLAQLFGWMPAGTDPPDPIAIDFPVESECLGRDGGYYPPHCQVMTRDDAQGFAQGLERALLDIPDAVESAQDLLFASWDGSPGMRQRSSTRMDETRAIFARSSLGTQRRSHTFPSNPGALSSSIWTAACAGSFCANRS
jgi:hypothetical protein